MDRGNHDLQSIDDALRQGKASKPNPNIARERCRPAPMCAEAFHGILGAIVCKIEPETEADPASVLIQLLVAFGNQIGRGPHYVVEDHKHHTNLFAVLVGSTSKGRKGTSWARVKSVLTDIDRDWTDKRIVSGLSSGEGLVLPVRDPMETQERIDDDETETLNSSDKDKRLLVQESEFASVLQVMARAGNTLSPIIRDAWDQGDLGFMTKNTPLKASDAHISIVAHVTDEELNRHLDRTETANGFANRFLFVCAKRSKCLPDGGGENEWGDLIGRLASIVEQAKQVGRMWRNESARVLWHDVYPKLSDGRPGLIGAVTGRAEAQVLRLSMIYALADGSEVIDLEHLEAALEVWRYCEDSARYVFGEKRGDPVADKIMQALLGAPEGLTRTEISNGLARHATAAQIDRALDDLATRQLVRSERIAGNGRPTTRWHTS